MLILLFPIHRTCSRARHESLGNNGPVRARSIGEERSEPAKPLTGGLAVTRVVNLVQATTTAKSVLDCLPSVVKWKGREFKFLPGRLEALS